MAQIDASQLDFNFTVGDETEVGFATPTIGPFFYSWVGPTSGNTITGLSALGDFLAGGTGTVNSFAITNSSQQSGISITGLNAPIADFVDATNTTVHYEKFWNAVLAGPTQIFLPVNSSTGRVSLVGDRINVAANETVTGSADTFTGDGDLPIGVGTSIGDALTVGAGGTLIGGNDTFIDVFGTISGDVLDLSNNPFNGTLIGGNDTVISTDRDVSAFSLQRTIWGDAFTASPTSTILGGDDNTTVTNASQTGDFF